MNANGQEEEKKVKVEKWFTPRFEVRCIGGLVLINNVKCFCFSNELFPMAKKEIRRVMMSVCLGSWYRRVIKVSVGMVITPAKAISVSCAWGMNI